MGIEIVVIGASAGGVQALGVVLAALPAGFPTAIAVVQHRGKDSDEQLVEMLQKHTSLPVSEPEDKQEIQGGQVCVAPAGYHLLIEKGCYALSTEAPLWYARPSIDLLFESAAHAYGPEALGMILTGANQDGAAGLAAIKAAGGIVVVQDPASAEHREMPEAAIAATPVDAILPLKEIGPYLERVAMGAARARMRPGGAEDRSELRNPQR